MCGIRPLMTPDPGMLRLQIFTIKCFLVLVILIFVNFVMLLIILSRNELANYFSFSLPQIDLIFSSRPLDQTTSWIKITRLGQTRPDQSRPDLFFSDRPLKETGFARPDQISSAFFHRPPSQASIVYQWAWHYYSTPSLHRQDAIISFLSQVRSIRCVLGHGRLIYKALDEPYKTYFPHTFGLKSLEFLFRLYLIELE